MRKNTFKKKIMAAMMAMFMAVGMVSMKADAKTAGTGIRESITAYTLYVRENENNNVLGKMRMTIESSYVQNVFTADRDCGFTTVSVSEKASDFLTNSREGLKNGEFCKMIKYAENSNKVYGICTVDY